MSKEVLKERPKPTIDINTILGSGDESTPAAETTNEQPTEMELPGIVWLSDIWGKKIELSPEIICGVLRQGHKMILTSSSKAGKTFCLIELALAVASGGKWLGFQCNRGKVLYINLELEDKSCFVRFQKVGAALKVKPEDVRKIMICNLRGQAETFDILAPKIVNLVKSKSFDLVIIDPIYKVLPGDECKQENITAFCNGLDLIAQARASVVYCHHHSKGAQGNKDPMDRGSGSGVFARDADAILDMTQIFQPVGEPADPENPNVTAWTLEGVLREFTPFTPKNIYFRYPLHEVCEDGSLDNAKPRTPNQKGGKSRGQQRETESIGNYKRFIIAYDEMSTGGEWVRIKDLAEKIGMSEKTIRSYASNGGFEISKGKIKKEGNTETR